MQNENNLKKMLIQFQLSNETSIVHDLQTAKYPFQLAE